MRLLVVFTFICLVLFASCTEADYPTARAYKVVQYTLPKEVEKIQLTPELALPAEEPGYTLIVPEKSIALAVAFHSGRDTSHPGYEMRFYTEALSRGVAVMYVTTGNHFEFLFDSARYDQLDTYIKAAVDTLQIPPDQLLFMGMSLAGTRAMKFASWCLSGKSSHGIRPAAVAICDAPLDFTRFWNDGAFAIKHQTNPTSANEATWVNYQLEKNLGGTPQEVPENYRMYSPYVPDMNIDDRLQLFSSVAVRVYTEPDILWWLGHRQKSYYGMNAIDAAALVRDLRVLGNEQAELIATTEKGHHPDGRRHPHSWSIVDNAELVDWFLESLHAPAQ